MRRVGAFVALYAVVAVALRVTVAAPEHCSGPGLDTLRGAATDAVDWLATNQRDDGSFLYELDREGGDASRYNEVRHAGVLLSLYQAGAVEVGDRGLDWVVARLRPVERGGTALTSDTSRASVGAAALLTAALVERRVLTHDRSHDALLHDLGRFLVAMQRDDGGFFVSVDSRTGALDTEGTSRYYPGEALWALARLESTFADEPWEVPARKAATFIATRRDEVEHVTAPPLNDHWAAYGFAEMAGWSTVDDDVAHYARLLYGRFALLIRTESAGDGSSIARRTHGPRRRAAALGTWIEGQAALARLAAIDDRVTDLGDRILDSARCGTGVLVHRQDDDGAWYLNDQTRMDDQQHAISGLLGTAALIAP